MQTGWFEALADPVAGAAIQKLHAEPSRAWNLEILAREVGSSRTILVQRFNNTMGVPPMTYLSRWRMQIAAGMLAGGSFRLARIAEEVGYESEAAFSRAFKRFTGTSPSQWRGIPGKQASIRPAQSTMHTALDGPMASQPEQISQDMGSGL
ncbi:MAG: AraC family transcriptional regulator [Halioglobus sp.]|nr:AraC family transcriptional regulator [Halioglobus sp.]